MLEWEQVGKTKRFSAYPGFRKLNLKMSLSFSLNKKNFTCANLNFVCKLIGSSRYLIVIFQLKGKIENCWFRIDNILKNKWKLTWHSKKFFPKCYNFNRRNVKFDKPNFFQFLRTRIAFYSCGKMEM